MHHVVPYLCLTRFKRFFFSGTFLKFWDEGQISDLNLRLFFSVVGPSCRDDVRTSSLVYVLVLLLWVFVFTLGSFS